VALERGVTLHGAQRHATLLCKTALVCKGEKRGGGGGGAVENDHTHKEEHEA
jgi:hypothetical protein